MSKCRDNKPFFAFETGCYPDQHLTIAGVKNPEANCTYRCSVDAIQRDVK